MPLRTKLFTTLYDQLGPSESVAGRSIEQIRRQRAAAAPARPPFTWVTGAVPRDVRISGSHFTARDGHEIGVRVYRPAGTGPFPLIVYVHGGGWVLGSVEGYDSLCTFLAHAAGALVLSVDYRMAPEHKAPQAVLDCVDAVRWVGVEAGALGGDPTRIAVAGDSAGGNLCAVVSRVVRDEGGPVIAHQALIYPGTDATMSHPSIHEHAGGPILTREDIEGFLELYVGDSGLDLKDPLVSPLWEDDLAGLPPALVQTADLDPLRDEGQAYAARLRDAGVPVRVTNYLGVPHGFMSFPGMTTCGNQARLELATELRLHLT